MAISAPHVRLLRSIKPLLPHGGRLLEIGEANWYGDTEPDFPCEDRSTLFSIAKAFYADLFAPREIVSVDMNGTEDALRWDLNGPLGFIDRHGHEKTFDIAINHGTAEHVFNIAQVFKTMHDATCTYGLMVHESPFTGWVDHGFYCLQPTLFYDLAAANNYEVVKVAIEQIESETVIELEGRDHVARLAEAGELPANAMLFVVFRKLFGADFRIPSQGYYARKLSAAGMEAWSKMR